MNEEVCHQGHTVDDATSRWSVTHGKLLDERIAQCGLNGSKVGLVLAGCHKRLLQSFLVAAL